MEQFDVFLAHNSQDKPLVRTIAQKLKQQNLKPWLDEEQIQGGDRIIQAVFNGISLSKTGAFFIGQNGLGKFQANLELDTVIQSFLEKQSQGFRVIPVLLPGVNNLPEELWYLKQWRWIKFNSSNDEAALQDLIQSIRNQKIKIIKTKKILNLQLIRRQVLQLFGLGTVGLLATVGFREILLKLNQPTAPKNELTINVQPTPTRTPKKEELTITIKPTPTGTSEVKSSKITPSNQIINSISLESEKGIDYTKLRNLLAAGNWKKADQETYQVIKQALDGKWSSETLLNFPCKDLRTINQMWVKYSDGHFGFSVQKEIYLSIGGKADGVYDAERYDKFSNRVGWDVSYSQLTFNTSSPKGHLPVSNLWFVNYGWFQEWEWWVGSLKVFSRIETCEL